MPVLNVPILGQPTPAPAAPGGLILPPGVAPPAAPPNALSQYAQQLADVQRSASQPIGASTPQWVGNQKAAWGAPASEMFGTGGGSMQNLTPRVPKTLAEATTNARATAGAERFAAGQAMKPNPNAGLPAPPKLPPPPSGPTSMPSPNSPTTGSNLMQFLTGQRPAPPAAPQTLLQRAASIKAPTSGWGKYATGAGNTALAIGGNVALERALQGADLNSPMGRTVESTARSMQPLLAFPSVAAPAGILGGAVQGNMELNRVAEDSERPLWERALGLGGSVGLQSVPGIGGSLQLAQDVAEGMGADSLMEMAPYVDNLLGSVFGDDGGGEQAQPAITADRLPDILTSVGLDPQTSSVALDELAKTTQLYRAYAEAGIAIPGAVDPETGEPLALTPEQAEQFATQQFLQSIPELVDMTRRDEEALARAAAYQAVLGDVMAPYAEQSRAQAELYPAMIGQMQLAPEVRGAMDAYAQSLGNQSLAMSDAYSAAGRLIPTQAALDDRQALQAQIDQMLLSQAISDAQSGATAVEEDPVLAALG